MPSSGQHRTETKIVYTERGTQVQILRPIPDKYGRTVLLMCRNVKLGYITPVRPEDISQSDVHVKGVFFIEDFEPEPPTIKWVDETE